MSLFNPLFDPLAVTAAPVMAACRVIVRRLNNATKYTRHRGRSDRSSVLYRHQTCGVWLIAPARIITSHMGRVHAAVILKLLLLCRARVS